MPPTIAEMIIEGKMDRARELDVSISQSGIEHQTLRLGLCRTILERSVTVEEGLPGDITVSTWEDKDLMRSSAVCEQYTLRDGHLVRDPSINAMRIERVGLFRVATTLAKVALGRRR